MTLSATGSQLFLTPNTATVGMSVINVDTWTVAASTIIPSSAVFSALCAMEGTCATGPTMLFIALQATDGSGTVALCGFVKTTLVTAWTFPLNSSDTGRPLFVAEDCAVYFGSSTNQVFRINALTGFVEWRTCLPPLDDSVGLGFTPMTGNWSYVNFPDLGSSIHAVARGNGTRIWSTLMLSADSESNELTAAPLSYDGMIFVSHPQNDMFYVIHQRTGTITYTANMNCAWSPVGVGNRVYFVTSNSSYYGGISWYDIPVGVVQFFIILADRFAAAPSVSSNGLVQLTTSSVVLVTAPRSRTTLWSRSGPSSGLCMAAEHDYVFCIFNGVTVYNIHISSVRGYENGRSCL